MATFKTEVQYKRADGTYNVRIRVIHEKQVRRISTNIYATQADLTKSLKIKNQNRLFGFYKHYADEKALNRAINIGLKQIGKKLGIDDLEFYAARHSWATIARSAAVGVEKATVHEALNHVEEQMKVTDIYIARDWSVIWDANRKVLAMFDWTAVAAGSIQ